MTQPAEPVPVTQDVVVAVANQLAPDELKNMTPEQIVQTVLTGWNAVREGDPPDTIRRDPATRAIAVRVNDNGVHMWHVKVPSTGEQYNDASRGGISPIQLWPIVYEPPQVA